MTTNIEGLPLYKMQATVGTDEDWLDAITFTAAGGGKLMQRLLRFALAAWFALLGVSLPADAFTMLPFRWA